MSIATLSPPPTKLEGEFSDYERVGQVDGAGVGFPTGYGAIQGKSLLILTADDGVGDAGRHIIAKTDLTIQLSVLMTLTAFDLAERQSRWMASSILGKYMVAMVSASDIRVFKDGTLIKTINESANLTGTASRNYGVAISSDGSVISIIGFADGAVIRVVFYKGV